MSKFITSLQMMGYIIARCLELKVPNVNITKLQKLMYCCYGACLAKYHFRICDQNPEAWKFGPVFPQTLDSWDLYKMGFSALESDKVREYLPDHIAQLIDTTLKYFGKWPASRLVDWTHLPNSPWSEISKNGKELRIQIPDSLIIEYFNKHVFKQS